MAFEGSYKGFNLLYGNVLSEEPLKCFTNTNNPEEKELIGEKRVQSTDINEYNGLSNGGLNKWGKVENGLYNFTQLVEFQEKEAET